MTESGNKTLYIVTAYSNTAGMLRILAQVRMQTIAKQGLRRQIAVAWYLLRKDARRAVSAHLHL